MNAPHSLSNKIALITGGASGIGLATARAMVEAGASVVLWDVQGEPLRQAVESLGPQSQGCLVDVTSQETVLAAVAELPRIDILVNNAGISHIGKAHTTSANDLDQLLAVNVKGVYHTLQACLPRMQQQKSGVIINMSSVAAHVGLADRFAYSLTKGAVHAMTLSVAKDYLSDGIRCNSVSPGRVHTAFVDGYLAKNYPGQEAEMYAKLAKTQPIGRMGQPEEIAHLIVYLASDAAAFITGTDFPIDGGFRTLNS